MKLKGALIILFILGLVILASCEDSTLRGERIVEGENESLEPIKLSEEVDACEGLSCPADSTCVNGNCECSDGQKLCGDSCISSDACCDTSECTNGQTCENNECITPFTCEGTVCSSNQVCSEADQGCACPGGYKWCERQEKCIPADHCCSRFDCSTNERCTETITSVELCIEGGGKACKIFDATGVKELSLPSESFTINVSRINYLEDVTIAIKDKSYVLALESPVSIGENTTLSILKLRETGGRCRDFDRDT